MQDERKCDADNGYDTHTEPNHATISHWNEGYYTLLFAQKRSNARGDNYFYSLRPLSEGH